MKRCFILSLLSGFVLFFSCTEASATFLGKLFGKSPAPEKQVPPTDAPQGGQTTSAPGSVPPAPPPPPVQKKSLGFALTKMGGNVQTKAESTLLQKTLPNALGQQMPSPVPQEGFQPPLNPPPPPMGQNGLQGQANITYPLQGMQGPQGQIVQQLPLNPQQMAPFPPSQGGNLQEMPPSLPVGQGSIPLILPPQNNYVSPLPSSVSPQQGSSEGIAFVFEEGKIHLYKTKTVAIRIDDDSERDDLTGVPSDVTPGESSIKVFDLKRGKTKTYIQTSAAVPFRALVELKDKFAQRLDPSLIPPEKEGKTIEQKLKSLKKFFHRVLGYFPMKLDQASVLNVEDSSEKGFQTMVVIPELYIPEKEDHETEQDVEDPDVDSPPSHPFHGIFHQGEDRRESSRHDTSLPSARHDFSPLSSQEDDITIRGLFPETQEDILKNRENLRPFVYNAQDERRIIDWVYTFHDTITTNPRLLKSYPTKFIEKTAHEVIRYLLSGEPEKGEVFLEENRKGWINWLDTVFLRKLERGEIETSDRPKNEISSH